jgi:hypothetical protein
LYEKRWQQCMQVSISRHARPYDTERTGCQAIPHGQPAFLRRGWSLMARPVPSPRDGLLDHWTGRALLGFMRR